MTSFLPDSGIFRNRLWLLAFVLTFLIPVFLIFTRGLADGSAVVIGLLFLWESHKAKQWKWLSDPMVRTSLLAWAWLVLGVSPFAVNPIESFSVALPWVRFILLFAALRYWVLERPEALRWMGYWMLALLALVAVDTLWQYVFKLSLSGNPIDESGRLTGPMDNVKVGLYIARLLLPALAICLYVAYGKHAFLLFSIYGIALLCMAAILLSGERTPFFSTLLGLASVVGALAIIQPRHRIYYLLGSFMALLLIAYAFSTQYWLQIRAHKLYETLTEFPSSSYGQLFWVGYELGKENLITGTGLKGFRELCLAFLDSGVVDHCNLHPHNPYIEWFAETGAIGLVLFLTMVGTLFYSAFIHLRKYGSVVAAFALGTCLMHFFPLMATQSFFSNWPALLLWYSLAVSFSALHLLSSDRSGQQT